MESKLGFNETWRKKVAQLCAGEFKIGNDGKLIPHGTKGAKDIPWVFINHDANKKFCWFWNGVCCGHFKIIHSHCRFCCWKVVVKPRTVKETFECYDIFVGLNLPSKIGMDVRPYTHGAWAGFFYCNTLDHGRAVYKRVRAAIPKRIPVILKRGCTEMEQLQDSNQWDEIPQEQLDLERCLNDLFSFNEEMFYQAQWHKNEIKENWILHAIKIGDPTARETAEKHSEDPDIWKKLVVHSVTYHEEEE